MRQYLEIVRSVLEHGALRNDRTGVGTLSQFGHQARYDLREGFPLLTTKRVNFDAVVRELLWFLSGSTNVNDLHPCRIWDKWADEYGRLGPIYSAQWRSWPGDGEYIDQIQRVIDSIKADPMSRRHIVSAWNVAELDKMALPPCHLLFQFYVADGHLDLQLYQRSADLALGVPFNIASYALLLEMVAREVGLKARHFIHTLGDAHVYLNHQEGLREQLTRSPRPLPKLVLADVPFWDMRVEHISLTDYDPEPSIRFKVAV